MLRRVSACAALSLAAAAPTERVSIERRSDGSHAVVSSVAGPLGWGGKIRGAGGAGHMKAASNAGADAMRTWQVHIDGEDVLGEELRQAEATGVRVSAGMWLPHDPSKYENCTDMDADPYWQAEKKRLTKAARQYKNSSALLWWTVGNEIELETDVVLGSECTWRRLDWMVQAVKAADPDHPVGTVLAGAHIEKVRLLGKFARSLDFLGVNAYGEESVLVGSNLRKANFTKPYAIMEFGPSGHWMAPLTEWGALIEESSSEKVPRYNATCHACYDDGRCLGAFAFVWGWKWEKTGTWYGMFNEWPEVTQGVAVNCTECQSEVMETMEACWTGHHRVERPPTIASISVDGAPLTNLSFVVPQKEAVRLKVNASHPLGRDLVGIWGVTNDVLSDAIGGAFEDTKPLMTGVWPGNVSTATGLSVMLNTSALPPGSEYRLYIFVRQDPASCIGECDKQEAVASLPFRICHDVVEGDLCFRHFIRAQRDLVNNLRPERYPGISANSSRKALQMLLHQQGVGNCPPPCGLREWCRTSVKGDECYEHVRWLMARVATKPDLYPKELWNATFEATQLYIQGQRDGVCPRPCAEAAKPESPDDSADSDATEVDTSHVKGANAKDVLPSASAASATAATAGTASAALALSALLASARAGPP